MSGYADWEIRDFTEGLIDKRDANIIPVNAAQDCQNVISRVIGRLKIRRGQLKLNSTALHASRITGLYPYYKEDGTKKLLAACNGSVYYWNTATSAFVAFKTGLTASAEVMFEACANYLVGFNGVDAPFKWDGTTLSVLANAPAGGKNPVLHKEQLFIQHAAHPSQLWWSDPFAPETWPAVNYWAFREGDGDTITCHIPFLGELIVFKRRSIHNLRGTSLDDFRSDVLNTRTGCVGPRAATVDNDTIMYFVSDNGIHAFNGLKATNVSEERIPNFWKRVNLHYIHNAAIEIWDSLVWVALPEGDSTVNNLIIIMDPKGYKFWVWRGINAGCLAIFNDGSSSHFYAGDSTATGYVRQQDTGSDDDGLPIEAYYIGQAHNQGTPDREKKAKQVFAETAKDWEIYPDTGTEENAYKVTLSPAISSYTDGLEVHLRAARANTGATTLSCNDLTDIPILRTGVATVEGDIKERDLVHVVYSSGVFNIQEPMQLSVALDESPTFHTMTLERTDGISTLYRFPASLRGNRWKYLTPKFYRNALGLCEIRGMMIPIKTKAKPKVRRARI